MEYQELLLKDIDPRSKDSEEPRKLTFNEVAEQWYQKNKHLWKDVTKNRHYKSLLRDIYPFIGHKPIDAITKAELLALIHPHEVKGHYEIAHRLHDRLETIFKFAVGSSLTENYPFIGLKNALAPKPRIVNQPAINLNEAHEMLAIIKNSRVGKVNVVLGCAFTHEASFYEVDASNLTPIRGQLSKNVRFTVELTPDGEPLHTPSSCVIS